jgi:hypothetical protein
MHLILKMEAARSPKTLVSYCSTAWHQNPEDLEQHYSTSKWVFSFFFVFGVLEIPNEQLQVGM